jgi:NTE family protein
MATATSTPSGFSLLEGIPEAQLRSLPRALLAPGTVVVAEGDYPGKMFVVLSGSAEVVVTDRRGHPRVVNTIAPGEPIGEMSLLTGQPASATVRTTEESELLLLRSEDLAILGATNAAVYRHLMAILAMRLAGTLKLATGRTAAQLVALDDRGAPDRLPYALACSLAWHARAPTLLVVVDESADTVDGDRQPRPGASVVTVPPQQLDRFLADARHTYDTVLVSGVAGETLTAADRVIAVGRPGTLEGEQLALEAWAPEASPIPPREPTLRVPALSEADHVALERQMLPTGSAAGAVLGWVSRELLGLRVGVALGAGSSRGYAHLGAIRALERHRIPIDCLAGTSIGAIISTLYAHLGDVDQVAATLDDLGEHVFRPTFSRRSLMSTRSLQRFVAKNIGDGLIEEEPIPLAIVTADLLSGEEVVLQRGSAAKALFAAMAVPGIFPPVGLGQRVLVDGGLLDPLPIGVAARLGAGTVIGVKLSGGPGTVRLDEISEEGDVRVPSIVGTILRAIELVQTHVLPESEQTSAIVVTPELGGGTLRNFKSGRRFIDAGDAAVEEAMPRIQAVLPWLRPDDRGPAAG